MLAQQIRSGLTETIHQGAVAVVAADGRLVASHGDIDRPFFLRSSAKPFQAWVSQNAGAELSQLELAIVSASHRGFPVQVSLVESVLAEGGLDESSLGCPPGWPIHPAASRLVQRRGATGPRRIWHNCSGKHAGFLRACVARGWPTGTYLEPDHPLQRRVVDTITEMGGFPAAPVGVDGCGAPVLRTTTRALATMFARLGTDPALSEVFAAMHRYPALIGANGEADSEIATACNAVAKDGAAGCIGVAIDAGLGIGVKSWDGLGSVAGAAAVSTLEQLGIPSASGLDALGPTMQPAVTGGGRPVGRLEPVFRLETT